MEVLPAVEDQEAVRVEAVVHHLEVEEAISHLELRKKEKKKSLLGQMRMNPGMARIQKMKTVRNYIITPSTIWIRIPKNT